MGWVDVSSSPDLYIRRVKHGTVCTGIALSLLLCVQGRAATAAGTASASAEASSSSRTDNPELEQVRLAVEAFRRVTSAALPGPGQRSPNLTAPGASGWSSLWHGRVFEYFRNDLLDAVPHEVVQRGGERNLRRRNQFGFTVNGPVVLPKLYDGRGSSFFTLSYEGTRERVGRSYLYTMPTAQQRLGDFSDLVDRAGRPRTVFDPDSTRRNSVYDASQRVSRSNLEHVRDAFPNNQIPVHRIDRVARSANEVYPRPNASVGPFLRNNYWANPSERNTPDGFITRLDHRLSDAQRLTLTARASDGFSDTPDIYPTAGNFGRPDRLFRNRDLRVSDSVSPSPSLIFNVQAKADMQVVDTLSLLGGRDLPRELGLEGVSGSVFPAMRFRGYAGLGASQRSYLRNAQSSGEIESDLVLRRGDHTWTVAGEAKLLAWSSLELDAPSGSFSFSERITGLPGINNTGDSYGTFLLGHAGRALTTDQPQPAYLRRRALSSSVSDQWQVGPNLTLSLRLRIRSDGPRLEKYDRQSSFDPAARNPGTGSMGALVFAGRDGVGRAFQPFRVRAEPRLGLSWSPTSRRDTVVRGSFQRMHSTVGLRMGPFGTQGYTARRLPLSPNRQLIPAVVLEDGFPPLASPLPDLRGDFANNSDVDMIPRTAAQPTLNYGLLEIERKLPMGLTIRARGRTMQGRDMLVGGQIAGLNRAPLEVLDYRDRLNDEHFRRSLRPYPHVQQIRMNYQYPGGKFRYDEGRLNLQKNTGDGLSLDLEYTYRRRWDDYSGPGIQNAQDRRTAWAFSRGLRPQRFSLSYTYELPFGPGKALLARSGLLAKLASDWSVSGFTTWLSGDPIVLEPLFNNTGGIVPYLRVDAVPGADPHVRDPGPERWFNAEAFVNPPDFAVGSVPRTHPTLVNPGYSNHDVALTKRVVVSQEQSVEVLLQSFNFINQGNWNDPDAQIGPPNARNVNAGRIIGSRGGRVLQLGLRYHF